MAYGLATTCLPADPLPYYQIVAADPAPAAHDAASAVLLSAGALPLLD